LQTYLRKPHLRYQRWRRPKWSNAIRFKKLGAFLGIEAAFTREVMAALDVGDGGGELGLRIAPPFRDIGGIAIGKFSVVEDPGRFEYGDA